jgi:hypothetical protein
LEHRIKRNFTKFRSHCRLCQLTDGKLCIHNPITSLEEYIFKRRSTQYASLTL